LQKINIADIWIPLPEAEAVPVSTIPSSHQYTGTVTWSPLPSGPGGTFIRNTIYTATINLTPRTNFTLQGVQENFFIIEGTSQPATNPANSGVITAIFPVTPDYFEGGIGTQNNPYRIRNKDHLQNIRHRPYSNFIIVDNINFAGQTFTPIPQFNGILNGNGKIISGMIIETNNPFIEYYNWALNAAHHGMIQRNWGTIKNLTLEASIVVHQPTHHYTYVGILTGFNHGQIINVTTKNRTNNNNVWMIDVGYPNSASHVTYAGGITGYNSASSWFPGEITNSKNYGNIRVNRSSNHGCCHLPPRIPTTGIHGKNCATVTNSSNSGHLEFQF